MNLRTILGDLNDNNNSSSYGDLSSGSGVIDMNSSQNTSSGQKQTNNQPANISKAQATDPISLPSQNLQRQYNQDFQSQSNSQQINNQSGFNNDTDPFAPGAPGGGWGDPWSADPWSGNEHSSVQQKRLTPQERVTMIERVYEQVLGRKPDTRDINYYKYSTLSEEEIVKQLLDGKEHKQLMEDGRDYKKMRDRAEQSETRVKVSEGQIRDQLEEFKNLTQLLSEKNKTIQILRAKLNNPYSLTNQKFSSKPSSYRHDDESTYSTQIVEPTIVKQSEPAVRIPIVEPTIEINNSYKTEQTTVISNPDPIINVVPHVIDTSTTEHSSVGEETPNELEQENITKNIAPTHEEALSRSLPTEEVNNLSSGVEQYIAPQPIFTSPIPEPVISQVVKTDYQTSNQGFLDRLKKVVTGN